jgi:multidrug efflux pump subunit AcrA (membrane-fusion protein)
MPPAAVLDSHITLGSAITILLVAAFGAFFTARANSGKTWREEAEAHKAKANRMEALALERERQLEQQQAQVAQLQEALATVGGKNVYEQLLQESSRAAERYESAVTAMQAAFQSLNERIDRHEQRADERHLSTLKVLDLIAGRLGPDPNGPDP